MNGTTRGTITSYGKALAHMKEAARCLGFELYTMADSVKKHERFTGFFLVDPHNFDAEETELCLDKYLTPLSIKEETTEDLGGRNNKPS